VTLFGEVLPRVQVDPPLLTLPADGASVRVMGGEVTAARLDPAVEGATVELRPGRAGEAQVFVKLPAGEGALPALVLETKVPGEERVTIPLRRAE